MKILMISTDRKILDTGSVVAERMREYAGVFGELHIVVFSHKSQVTSLEIETSDFQARDFKLKLSDNCFVYPTRSRSKISYIFDAVRIGRRIALDFQLSAFDSIVTTQDPFETGIVGLALAKKFSLKFNVQVHTDFLSPYFTVGSALNRIRRLIAGYVLPRASSVRVVSERIRTSLSHISNVTVLPIYSGTVDLPTLTSDRFPQFEKVVLMVSRLEKEKDMASAFRAFAVASESFPRAGLVVVGSGALEAELTGLSLSLGIGDKVLFLGWRDEIELSTIRASSDVFLSTSLYEGYGLSLIESARAHLPIVSTDVGIAPELLAKDKLALPGDVEKITSLLIEALQHPERFMVDGDAIAKVTYPNKAEYLERLKRSLLI